VIALHPEGQSGPAACDLRSRLAFSVQKNIHQKQGPIENCDVAPHHQSLTCRKLNVS
jgi:hypothetical protein